MVSPSCPVTTATSCYNTTCPTDNLDYYQWSIVQLTASGSSTTNLILKPTYYTVFAANTAGSVTYKETVSFPAGWGSYLTVSGFSGTYPAGAAQPTVAFFIGTTPATAATATSATITWTFKWSFDCCWCGSILITFAVPNNVLDVKTPRVVTHSSAQVTATVTDPKGVPACTTNTGKSYSVGLLANNASTGVKATMVNSSTTLMCLSQSFGMNEMLRDGPFCGGVC